jgi:FAD/FMN-containing dehydrogenase
VRWSVVSVSATIVLELGTTKDLARKRVGGCVDPRQQGCDRVVADVTRDLVTSASAADLGVLKFTVLLRGTIASVVEANR